MTEQPQFDIYPHLDKEIKSASKGEGNAGNNIDSLVKDELGYKLPFERLTPEAASWARVELNNNFADGVLGSWKKYEDVIKLTVPDRASEFLNAELAKKVEFFYQIKQGLIQSDETTPDGQNIGQTLKLVAIPWHSFKYHLEDFDHFMWQLRQKQALPGLGEDLISDTILNSIKGGGASDVCYVNPERPSERITAADYLQKKTEEDGIWGLMLMQTSGQPGSSSLSGKSIQDLIYPDHVSLVNGRAKEIRLAGVNVGAMGIFEWLSLTLQENPGEPLRSHSSLLPANRFWVGASTKLHVGLGECAPDRVITTVASANIAIENSGIRLAVG